MNLLDQLEARTCPVCGGSAESARLFLEQTVDRAHLGSFSFASRKVPEYVSFRLVTCPECTTVYAAAAPRSEALAEAYLEADYDSAEEARLAADAYESALRPFFGLLRSRERALEIGTGTGVMLTRLRRAGFSEVVGVEPSRSALEAAEPEIRSCIREGIFREEDFMPESFDLICCFQTLEHVPAPRSLVASCVRLLRPGGMLALVTHDYRAPFNRLLGRRSPIIDIEHLQLFNRPSLERLITTSGLQAVVIRTIVNRYPLRYWLRLAPLPGPLKTAAARFLKLSRLERFRLGINVGNLMTLGRKPA